MIKVLLFSSTSCLPCEKFKPIISSVCDELEIPLQVIWKETDKENSFARYGVISIPNFTVMKKDKDQWLPFNSYVGTKSRTELLNLLNRYKEED